MKKPKTTVATEQPSNRPGNQATSYNGKPVRSNLALPALLTALPPAYPHTCVVLGNYDPQAIALLLSSEKIQSLYIVGPNWKHPDSGAVVRLLATTKGKKTWPTISAIDNFLQNTPIKEVSLYYISDPIYNKHFGTCAARCTQGIAGKHLTQEVSGSIHWHNGKSFTHHDLTWTYQK